jgi:hypothetical protein
MEQRMKSLKSDHSDAELRRRILYEDSMARPATNDSMKLLLRAVTRDVIRFVPGVKGLERDLVSLEARYEHEGIGFLTVALPALGKALDRGLSDGRFTCPSGFEKIRGGAIPKLFQGLLCNVFDAKTGEYISCEGTKDVYYVSVLRQLLYFFKKFNPSTDRADLLDKKAKEDFAKCDREIGTLAPFDMITSNVSAIMFFEVLMTS